MPTRPKPQMAKYVTGKTPSTIQKMIGNITSPGAISIAKNEPKHPNQLLIAANQKININIPAPIHIIIPTTLSIRLIRFSVKNRNYPRTMYIKMQKPSQRRGIPYK